MTKNDWVVFGCAVINADELAVRRSENKPGGVSFSMLEDDKENCITLDQFAVARLIATLQMLVAKETTND